MASQTNPSFEMEEIKRNEAGLYGSNREQNVPGVVMVTSNVPPGANGSSGVTGQSQPPPPAPVRLPEEADDDEKGGERGNWGGRIEFIMTMIGSAVGLGNVWRFPYLAYSNGGSAFLIPYIIMVVLVGFPLFYLESAIGQFSSLSTTQVFKLSPLFKGLGFGAVVVSFVIASYYNILVAQCMFFLVSSFSFPELPWVKCDPAWATPECREFGAPDVKNITVNRTETIDSYCQVNVTNIGLSQNWTTLQNVSCAYTRVVTYTKAANSPAEEYYDKFFLEITTGIHDLGGINWKFLAALAVAWIVTGAALIRGVASLGKVAYFTALFPYLMLTVLLVFGLTLNGSEKGLEYFFVPRFEPLLDSKVWTQAASQVFFSASIASGQIIAMASFNQFKGNMFRDAIMVVSIDAATSVFAGAVTFSILGFMAAEKGAEIKDVVKQGPGLAFQVFPQAISRMPVPQLWAILFFLMMITLGLGSQFGLVETVISCIIDEAKAFFKGNTLRKTLFRLCMFVIFFLLAIPMVTKGGIYVFTIIDHGISGIPLLVIGLAESIVLVFIYGFDRIGEDSLLMADKRPNIFWRISVQIISPIVLVALVIMSLIDYSPPTYGQYEFPTWAQIVTWAFILFPLNLLFGWFVFYYMRSGGYVVLREVLKPEADWAPATNKFRRLYYQNLRESPALKKQREAGHEFFQNGLKLLTRFAVRFRKETGTEVAMVVLDKDLDALGKPNGAFPKERVQEVRDRSQ